MPDAPADAPVDPIKALLAEKTAEVAALREQLEALAKAQAERDAEAERQRLALIAERDGAAKALEEQRQAWDRRLAELDAKARDAAERWLTAERDRTIAAALSAHQWLEGGAATAARLLADEIEASFGADGRPVVRGRTTGLPAEQVIAELLSRPPYTHLQAAPGTGGSGATAPPPAGTVTGELGSNPVESALARSWLARLGPQDGIPGFGPRSLQ